VLKGRNEREGVRVHVGFETGSGGKAGGLVLASGHDLPSLHLVIDSRYAVTNRMHFVNKPLATLPIKRPSTGTLQTNHSPSCLGCGKMENVKHSTNYATLTSRKVTHYLNDIVNILRDPSHFE